MLEARKGAAVSTTSPGSSKAAKTSGNGNGAPDGLYDGWMTGWAYQAIRDLYFARENSSGLSPDDWKNLAEFTYAYSNIIEEWGEIGFEDLTSCMGNIRKHVSTSLEEMKKGDRSDTDQRSKRSQFEGWFKGIEGAARTKGPYVSDVMEFSSAASQWSYSPTIDQMQLFKNMRDDLLPKIKSAVPASAHEIVSDDMGRLLRVWRHDFSWAEKRERRLVLLLSRLGRTERRKVEEAPVDEQREAKKRQLVREWSELILGAESAREILNWWGRTTLYVLLGMLGITSFILVGVAFFFLITEIPALFGVALSKLTISDLNTILSIVAAVGISLPVLATKLWGGLIAAEHQLAIKLTRVVTFRRNSLFSDLILA